MANKVKPKLNKAHRIFFRFLKENGVFSSLDKNKLLSKNYLPENYFQCCALSLKDKRALKKEWLDLILPEINKIKFKEFLSFLDKNSFLKDTYEGFLAKHCIDNTDFFEYFNKANGVYPITSFYRYSFNPWFEPNDWATISEFRVDEQWSQKCNKLILENLSEDVE